MAETTCVSGLRLAVPDRTLPRSRHMQDCPRTANRATVLWSGYAPERRGVPHVGHKRRRPSEAPAEADEGLLVHDALPLAPLRSTILDPFFSLTLYMALPTHPLTHTPQHASVVVSALSRAMIRAPDPPSSVSATPSPCV